MITYFVLTPPGGPDRDHVSTRFVADKFAWVAFIFPGFWLLFHRCWLIGLATLALQAVAVWMTEQPSLFWAGTLTEIAISLLIGLEAHHIHVRNLVSKGWTLADLVAAPDLATAEAFYFSMLPTPPRPTLPSTDWSQFSSPARPAAQRGPALGLFDIGEGR